MVHILTLKWVYFHYFGAYVGTVMVLGPFGSVISNLYSRPKRYKYQYNEGPGFYVGSINMVLPKYSLFKYLGPLG